jgi:purine-cytosine permease-like protein
MWGLVYQGYNAVFPSFFPELFPARTRVTGMAIAQNFGVFLTSLLPAIYAAIAPPKSEHIVLKVGSITFVCMLIVAISALCARENSRIRMEDLGNPNAVPVPKEEYERLRAASIANAG